MARARSRFNGVRFAKAFQDDMTPIMRRISSKAMAIAASTAPTRGDIRPGKSEALYSQHKAWHTKRGPVRGNFFLENSASYALYVALGRGAISKPQGRPMRFPGRSGGWVTTRFVRGTTGNDWMHKAMQRAIQSERITVRVKHTYDAF